ncbi:MAG: mucoidy inhibitor MuiA family protein [Planctomycetes bacterium]|nr:mucoidy inhibitor MuiA family protein [Planctomycetota bacterium]
MPTQTRRHPLRIVVIALSAAALCSLAGVAPSIAQPAAPRQAQEAAIFTGAIDAVTVYRGQAQVTRSIDVPGGPGLREIVITGLPEAIQPGSLYAESSDGLEVRSVSYRIRPIGEDSRDEVRKAERAVRDAHDAVEAANARSGFLAWQRQYLDKLEAFVAPSAQAELKSGILNAETLSKLTDLVTTQRRAQTDEGQKLSLESRTLQEALQLRERELAVLTANTSRTAREAVVFLNVTKAGAKLRLTYVVSGANWSPSYNLRVAGAAADKVLLEYQASVQQMSGEDWSNVQLTLSTATPALVATGPMLQPLTVALSAPQQAQGAIAMLKDKSYDEAKKALVARQRDMEQSRQVLYMNNIVNAVPRSGGAQTPASPAPAVELGQSADQSSTILSLDAGLNEVASQSQLLDLISTTKVERKNRAEPVAVRQGDEGVSVSYKVAGRTTMPSRADQQLIQIAQLELPARVDKSATPTLTQYVYNEARITNSSDMVLLAGPASSYVGGEFVGSAGVPTIAAGESFRAGFGIDTSLRAAKELVERTETTQGGNRVIEFTYKLTIENFGKTPAPIRLQDRLPSPKGTDIRLTMVSETPSLSDDKDYLDTDRKKNLLRWDITVPPGATGTKAYAAEYKFRIEFDKQMMLSEGQ